VSVQRKLTEQIQVIEAFGGSLEKANSIRERVRIADRLLNALTECEKLVEQCVVSGMTSNAEDLLTETPHVDDPEGP
jgi:hypothetical protein